MTGPNYPFPWPQVMSFGLGKLRLAPTEFWSLTLPELNAALQAHYPADNRPLSRQQLNDLMRRHPDNKVEAIR